MRMCSKAVNIVVVVFADSLLMFIFVVRLRRTHKPAND